MSPHKDKDKYALAVERAKHFYQERIKPELGDTLNGQWVVIDANSGEYEIHEDVVEALEILKSRVPDLERVFVHEDEFTEGDLAGYGQVLWNSMPQESRDSVPRDGSLNLDHYLYGSPKLDKYPWQEQSS